MFNKIEISNNEKYILIMYTNETKVDFVIIGAGIYGLYAAKILAEKKLTVCVLECERDAFTRASYVNQARVHLGYHYPRSITTALKSAGYFYRFCSDFKEGINCQFKKIYALAKKFSHTNYAQFIKFCDYCDIPAIPINPLDYFQANSVEGAFVTTEYAFDAMVIKNKILARLANFPNVKLCFNSSITAITLINDSYALKINNNKILQARGIINASYAATNQILQLFNFEQFKIKYEMAEVILVKVGAMLKNVGITIMDGPFFSLMPFGKQDMHSITAVEFTPHKTCYNTVPSFNCQTKHAFCNKQFLGNCAACEHSPKTSYDHMRQLSKKYLRDECAFSYRQSLFAVKPILMESEVDDSRPTLIMKLSSSPVFITVFSGKINTIYDMEEALDEY